jgi:hypothetical protein
MTVIRSCARGEADSAVHVLLSVTDILYNIVSWIKQYRPLLRASGASVQGIVDVQITIPTKVM